MAQVCEYRDGHSLLASPAEQACGQRLTFHSPLEKPGNPTTLPSQRCSQSHPSAVAKVQISIARRLLPGLPASLALQRGTMLPSTAHNLDFLIPFRAPAPAQSLVWQRPKAPPPAGLPPWALESIFHVRLFAVPLTHSRGGGALLRLLCPGSLTEACRPGLG